MDNQQQDQEDHNIEDSDNPKPKHDKIFRKAFENPIVAKEFFDMHLPKEIKALFSPHTLKMEKESFVEPSLKNSISDVLFSAKFNNDTGYFWILLEHQSTSDHFMALRLFKYMLNIAQRHLTLHPKSKYIPFVYPLIFYNSKKKYNAPRNIWDLFKNKELAQDVWCKDYQLINVHDIPDEELKKKAWAGILQFFMKHINERNLLKRWYEIADMLPQFAQMNIGIDYLELILCYTLIKIAKSDRIKLEHMLKSRLNTELGEKLMTSLAHHWEQQGVEKGIAQGVQIGKNEGIQIGKAEGKAEGIAAGIAEGESKGKAKRNIEVAKNMLAAGSDPAFISKVTGLDEDIIIALIKHDHD